MSKIGVLEADQAVSDSPLLYETKSEAFRRVRRGWADKINDGLIRRRTTRAECVSFETVNLRSLYIPETLPPIEVPNCYFDAPPSMAGVIGFLAAQNIRRSATLMPWEI